MAYDNPWGRRNETAFNLRAVHYPQEFRSITRQAVLEYVQANRLCYNLSIPKMLCNAY